jgi:hypothetical protein
MEPDDWGFHAPLPSGGNKRHLSVDGDDALRDSKKRCMQPLEFPHGYGTAVMSSHIISSWETQNGILNGSVNTLQQYTRDTYSPGLLRPQDTTNAILWHDLLGTALDGGPAPANLSADFPVQSIGAETYHPVFTSSRETLIDVSAFPTVTQTDLKLKVSRAVIHPVHSTLISSPQLIISARTKPAWQTDLFYRRPGMNTLTKLQAYHTL